MLQHQVITPDSEYTLRQKPKLCTICGSPSIIEAGGMVRDSSWWRDLLILLTFRRRRYRYYACKNHLYEISHLMHLRYHQMTGTTCGADDGEYEEI